MASKSKEVSTVSSTVQAHIAEFNQLRGEINVYHDHQKEEIYFAMIVLGGIFATLVASNITSVFPEVFLIFPLILTSLALAYADRTVRILRIATYIHQHLRQNLIRELGTSRVLQWEVFKKHRVSRRKEELDSAKPSCFQDRVLLWFKRNIPEIPLILDVMRVAQFVVPSIFCVLLFVFVNNRPWGVFQFLLVAVSIIIAVLPVYFFVKSEETSGISLVSEGADLMEWERSWRSKHE